MKEEIQFAIMKGLVYSLLVLAGFKIYLILGT